MRVSRASAALCLALSVLAGATGAFPAGATPMLIAHRGGAGLRPENTTGAFRGTQAMFEEAGVEGWLELDTQFTSDRVLVVMHDATLDRTTDCTGAVVDHTAADLAGCNAAAKFPGGWPEVEPIPTLQQVLTEGRDAGWRLMIEIKDIPAEPGFDPDCAELAGALAALVADTGFPVEDLIVQSFWPICLEQLELGGSGIPTLLLTSSTSLNEIIGADTPVPLGFTLAENAVVATALRFEYSAPDEASPDLIEPVISAAHALGRRVVVWTVNDADRIQEVAALGIDGIISDYPDRLLESFGL